MFETPEEICEKLVENNADFQTIFWPDEELSEEQVDQICDALQQNLIVESISFENDEIDVRTCLKLAAVLSTHATVKEIKLFEASIEEFGALAIAFHNNTNLSKLSFIGCEFTPADVQGLRLLLETNSLTSLRLFNCEADVTLSGSLAKNTSLLELELENAYHDSSFTFEAARELPQMMANNRNLRVLELGLYPENTVETVLSVIEVARSHEFLQMLKLSIQDDEEGGYQLDESNAVIRALTSLLQDSPSLNHLELQELSFGSEVSLGELAESLEHNTTLQGLKIAATRNKIIEIAGVLSLNRHLRKLWIYEEDNGVGSDEATEAVVAIAQALTINTTLEELTYGDLRQKSACTFFEMMPQMNGLKKLHLCFRRNKRLSSATESSLLAGLQQNMSLESVDTFYLSQKTKAKVDHLTLLNQGGRRALTYEEPLPLTYWSRLLAKKSTNKPDVLYFFLQEKPDVLISQSRARMIEHL